MAATPKCPTCDRPAIPIVYGLPSQELLEQEERGLVKLGGCTINAEAPAYFCTSCDCSVAEIPPRQGPPRLDSQTVELLGRNRLVSELLRARLEVALPLRDRGVDLIAYVDLGTRHEKLERFVACPIQMKTTREASFGVWGKYAKFPNLILAFVWYIEDPERTVTYALTHRESVEVAERMGWTKTKSWNQGYGAYSTTSPSPKLRELLQSYKMTRDAWREKITGIAQSAQAAVPHHQQPGLAQ